MTRDKTAPVYSVLAVPLNRPEVIAFLLPPRREPRGASLTTLAQRPTPRARQRWLARLAATPQVTLADVLAIDHPHTHLAPVVTGHLVPAQFLDEPGFLTRNLGGWSPIFFGVAGLPPAWPADPLLDRAEVLSAYGPAVVRFGADPDQVAARLPTEMGVDLPAVVAALGQLNAMRPPTASATLATTIAIIDELYARLAGAPAEDRHAPSVPRPLLLDELMDWLVNLELARRRADAAGDAARVAEIERWQSTRQSATGLRLILKGEYIVGRHRRSTVLIAPELGVVVKQPGPEPRHEIELEARSWQGRAENWPVLTGDGAVVTPRGRIRQVVSEGLIPRLHQALHHPMAFYTLLGLTVEPFVPGPTTQEMVLADPAALTPALYDVYVFHQQVCEALGVENGDWHAANFVRREGDGRIVHIDWGAARPLHAQEQTPAGRQARLNQVQNIAYSFQDEALAQQTLALHRALLHDSSRLARLSRRAEALVNGG